VLSGHGRVLVIGYGNPGRLDDGLGPALASRLSALDLPGVTVESDYQLNIEHAAMMAEHDTAILADASVDAPKPYSFGAIEPVSAASFTSHSVSPGALAGLARDLYGWSGRAYLLGIRGYDFNAYEERLSPGAESNLTSAIAFTRRFLDEAGQAGALDSAVTMIGERT
jgi:hydrogenase maturation protease